MKKISLLSMLFLSFFMLLTSPISVNAKKELSEEEKQREELREIWDDYQVVETVQLTMSLSECIGPEFCLDPGDGGGTPQPTTNDPGVILIALDSITDHVGIVKNRYYVIEANKDGANEVKYEDNNWESRYDSIKGLVVTNASESERLAAVAYAENQIGEPYEFFTDRWTEHEWTCSKLVWRAYYEQGYDIEGRDFENRGLYVTPGDILDSYLTSVFYTT